jgi:hypothetical protein
MNVTQPSPVSGFPTHGPTAVETSVRLVMTRFRVRSCWGLLATWIDYKRLERRLPASPGLLKQMFVLEGLHSVWSISVWDSAHAIDRFGAQQPFHVAVANAIFPRIMRRPDGRPEIWSIRAKPISVSSNLNWDDLDLRSFCTPLHEEEDADVLHE